MEQKPQQPQGNINLNIDSTPIMYTDMVIWNISPDGVVLNFAQSIMGSNQVKIIARLGMSRDHAKRFAGSFGKDLALTEVQGQSGKAVS